MFHTRMAAAAATSSGQLHASAAKAKARPVSGKDQRQAQKHQRQLFVNRLPVSTPANASVQKRPAAANPPHPKRSRNTSESNISKVSDDVFTLKHVVPTKVLKVGSDCSGLASECIALSKLGIDNYKHVFACDINKFSKAFIEANYPPQHWFDDCLSVQHQRFAPYVDVYVAGFPCQPFSAAGANLGLDDLRGKVVHGVIAYIKSKLPVVFVLENVKNLMSSRHEAALECILKELSAIQMSTGKRAYDVTPRLLNSKNYGVPQSRERLYIIGRREDKLTKREMRLASTAKPPPIREYLNIVKERPSKVDFQLMSKVVRRNLEQACNAMKSVDLDPLSTDMVVDINNGQGLTMMHNICPTITRARGQSGGFFLTSVSRPLSRFELCRLQGFEPEKFHWPGIPMTGVGALAGNAMTIPVLAAVLREALLTTGLAKPSLRGQASFP